MRIFNTTDSPVVYDEPGHIVDGYSAADAKSGDKVTERLIAAGVLVAAEPEPEAEPDAKPTARRGGSKENA